MMAGHASRNLLAMIDASSEPPSEPVRGVASLDDSGVRRTK
jgi:hypothetical protein